MTSFPAPIARPARSFAHPLGLMFALCAVPMSAAFAQSVEFVTVSKAISYVQTSATNVIVDPRPPGPAYGGSYWFGVEVVGQNLSGITPPTFSGPINTGALGSWYNTGKLIYNPGDSAWKAGSPFANNWGSPTQSDLTSKFGSGTYTITVQGTSVSLQLNGAAYPNIPVMTLSGGTWSGGKYLLDTDKPLTITTNPFTAYGSTPNALISIDTYLPGVGTAQLFSAIPALPFPVVPGTNTATYTVPAGTFAGGQEYPIEIGFQSVVDIKPNASLPGSTNIALFNTWTTATLVATKPVFPMVVTGSITPSVANINAAIQYRPQDVGTSGSVYVFALAPSNKVMAVSAAALSDHKGPVTRSTGTTTTATPLPCVLAQLTSNGQLTAATASSLQAYLTGVLSSQGASVSVLNNVSTALLSGAVFYIGYGSNSSSMINSGVHRNVVAVPGTQTCQPQAPQTGWWWNAAQDGRGFGIEVRGNNLFMSGYLYDESGHATWVVSPGPVALDGSLFNGTMYQVANGQTLAGNYKAPSPPTTPGPITLSFTDARNGTLIWPGGSIPLVRFDDVIGSGNGVTPSFVPENGWWWNADESGRGFFLEIKNNFMFIAGYMYEADGRPVWYVAQNPMTTPQSFSSTWLQVANGQTMTGVYKKPVILNGNVGPVSILFSDASHAVMTLPGGKQLSITRQRF